MHDQVQKEVEKLMSGSTVDGCNALKQLLAISKESDACYPYMGTFFNMLSHDNSYIRTRGLLLIVENAKWDKENTIDEGLDDILPHITDAKPITARQFIQSLPTLALAKPQMRATLLHHLSNAHTWRYPLSMRGLVERDIQKTIAAIQSMVPPI